MGHIRLGVLPKTKKWNQVVALLEDNSIPVTSIADKILEGSQEQLAKQGSIDSVGYCIWLLANLALGSRSPNYLNQLENLGINASVNSSAAEIIANTSETVLSFLSKQSNPDAIAQISELALRETMAKTISLETNTLFGNGLPEFQNAFRKFSSKANLASLFHIYFSSFLSRTVNFVLDKEVSNHVGAEKRLKDVEDLQDFKEAINIFASSSAKIVEEFSGSWFSKTAWEKGEITKKAATGFSSIALKKLFADLGITRSGQ